MSDAYAPFIISSLAATVIGILPIFVGWRMTMQERDYPLSKQEKNVNYTIMACVGLMHVAEALKAAYFGLEYNDRASIFSFMFE